MEDIWDPLAPKVPSIARGMRILLVDSDTTSLMFMATILESHSYKVTTIELSSVAMSIYAERKDEFDVVLANVHLHNITDLEFVQEILKKKNTPIILMSSAGVMDLRDIAPLGGACHFYEKPVSSSQLREVWQHVYRERISKEGGCEKNVNGGNETERVQMVEVGSSAQRKDEAHLGLMTRKSVGIQIREGGTGSRTAHGNEFQASDPKGKNKQVVGEVGSGHHGDAQATATEQLRKIAADQNQRCGDRRRANDDDDKGGRGKYKRRINPEHSPSKAGGEKKQNGRSSDKKPMRWSRELHFKFTAAISKLGEEKANPKAIQDLMNVPNLSQRQISHQLEKYKAQVQIIMDTCVDTPRWVPSSWNVSKTNVNGTTGVPQLQEQQGGLVGTGVNPPLRLLPPVSLQSGSLNLKTPNNRPGYVRPNDSGRGRHQGSIQIRERELLPTPFKTNDKGKGKQTLGFQGNTNAPYVPPVQHWQDSTPSPTFTRLSEQQHLMAGTSSSANPPNSNLPASTSTSAAGTSANQSIPGDPLTGHGGFDESDDLACLTEWLSRSLKDDNTDPPTFDWSDM